MELDQFIANNGITIDENVKIKYTEEFGYGVYLNACDLVVNGKSIDGKRYEVMRIPQKASWGVRQCVEFVEEIDPDLRTLINSFIRHLIFAAQHGFSETFTLTIYFAYFVIFSKGNKMINDRIGDYLKILQNTKIDTPLSELIRNEDVEGFYKISVNENWETPGKDIELLGMINESLPSNFDKMSLEEFIHLKIVIRSRVLEIPEELEDDFEDDFEVNTTLVPILDFVNHNNDLKNSWFDVDRDTKDILLIYENNGRHDHDLQLFFSYSPVEDIRRFAFTYGFIPKSRSPKLLEMSIDKEYVQKHYPSKYQFCKQFNIVPTLPFIAHFEENEVKLDELNLSENRMYTAFSGGLRMEETTTDGGDTKKFVYWGEQVKDSWHMIELLTKEGEHRTSYEKFVYFVNNYLEYRLEKLDTELNKCQDEHHKKLVSYQLIEFEKKLIESFKEKFILLSEFNKIFLTSTKDDYNEYKMWSTVWR